MNHRLAALDSALTRASCPEWRRTIAELRARLARQIARDVGATPTTDKKLKEKENG